MKIFQKKDSHLFCGHWNGSPLEIGVSNIMKDIPIGEVYHSHGYHEYYVVLQGRGSLLVEDKSVPLEANSVVMLKPGEWHKINSVDT